MESVKTSTKKTVTLKKDIVHLDNGMKASEIPIRTPIDAYKATMLMMMKHVADVHEAVLQIVSEKYKIKLEDMMDAVIAHPKWRAVLEQPVIYDLTQEIHENASEITAPPQPPKEKKTRAPRKPKADPALIPAPTTTTTTTTTTTLTQQTTPSVEQFTCPACGLGSGADHRMCICRSYNYSVAAWETACGIRKTAPVDDELVLDDEPVPLIVTKANTKKSKAKPKVIVPVGEELCLD